MASKKADCLALLTICILLFTSSVTYNMSGDEVSHHHRKPRKLKRVKSRINYYANSVATFNLLLSGDIEENPGPGLRAPKCTECEKGVGTNRKRLECKTCLNPTHAACSNLPKSQQIQMTSRIVKYWTCKNCLFSELPFFNVRELDLDGAVSAIPAEEIALNHDVNLLKKHQNQTSIAHINTQSLLSTFDEFSHMLNTYNFDIITLSETWLQDNQNQLNYVKIPGYNTLFKNRLNRKSGGVGIYAKENLKFKTRHDLTKDCMIEAVCAEFCGRNKNTPYLLLTVYQPSSREDEKIVWLNLFETLVANITMKWLGVIIITGDTNIDLIGENKESTRRYKDILSSYNLIQHVTKPTRNNKTLIDHIITNIPDKVKNTNVVGTDEISDHDTPYVILNIKKERYEPRYRYIRDEKNFNMNEYVKDFSKQPFNVIYAFDDPEDQLNALNSLILNCIERHAPLKRVKLTRPVAPWMKDPVISNARHDLEKARLIAQRDPSQKTEYRSKRADYRKTLKNIKNKFLRKSLSTKDTKIVWNTIHRMLKNQKSRIKHHPNEMNDYFSNLAANLTGKYNTESRLPNRIQINENQNSFRIEHTTYNEVNKILNSLKNDCSSGADNIPVRYVKPVADYITFPLVHIINTCIDQSTFPKQWKIARVCPIPKIEIPNCPKDYRPISVLPVLSKTYERVILKQLCYFIEEHNLYNETQSGFRKGHSTNTLLLKFRDDIKKAMKRSEVTLSILIDYSKAFDTIDHGTLLRNLCKMNFSSSSVEIISSYLHDRHQFVQIEDKVSSIKPMYFGVPQGSILGPVLFNLYVVEIANNIESTSIQYADDTTLYRHCKIANLSETIAEMQRDVQKLLTWSRECNLLFNSDKLQFILFHSKRIRDINDRHYLFRCSGKSIEQRDDVKLLGVQFDRHLSWTTHINNIIKSAQGTLRALRNFRRFTPFHVRKTLAETLILSKIHYCNVVYAQIPKYLIERLQRIQNIAAGYVHCRYATAHDVIKLKWLPIKEYAEFNTVKLVHRSRIDPRHPSYLNVQFALQRNNLRSASNEPLVNPTHDGTFQEQAYVYDRLPEKIKIIDNLKEFDREARKFQFDRAFARILASH